MGDGGDDSSAERSPMSRRDDDGSPRGRRADEADDEVELSVDERGRVLGTSDCGLDFRLAALMCPVVVEEAGTPKRRAASLRRLRGDCRALFGHEDSHWLPAGMQPRCSLERLAADIFRYHTRDVSGVDMGNSGAEWWVQMREAAGSSASESIGFHWDKDEDLVDSCGISLHPQLSTVTYLSSCGAPTMVCSRRAPLEYGNTEALYSAHEDFTSAFLSYPSCLSTCSSLEAKHLVFDGQLLHGAPQEFSLPGRDLPGDGSTRYTFLVNIWLGHTPLGLSPLPEEALTALSDELVRLELCQGKPCRRAEVQAGSTAGDCQQRYSTTFGPTGTQHELSFGHPAMPGVSDLKEGGVCTLNLDLSSEGAHGQIRPAPRPELSTAPTFCELPGCPVSWLEFQEVFLRFQLAIVRGGAQGNDQASQLMGLQHLRRLYQLDPAAVERTWCVENGDGPAESVLKTETSQAGAKRPRRLVEGQEESPWYASFVLNRTSKSLGEALGMLPVKEPGFLSHAGEQQAGHTPNVWFFFGQNPSKAPLEGRPEHTDKIRHSGTWHAQQSGEKVWFVRPDEEAEWPAGPCPLCLGGAPLEVRVGPGDIILINTRLWYHRTELPSTTGAPDELSFSYARDFYLGGAAPEDESSPEMDNCDDTWATEAILEGAVVAEGREEVQGFPTSAEPNCMLKIDGNSGETILVASRDIKAGESLTIPAP